MYAEGMPDEAFRFHKRELDRWCDGKERKLTPGVDFPASFELAKIKLRLVQAAMKRDVDIAVWYLDGNVHFAMVPWARFQGGNPD
jgi:hypothetical protein